MDAITRKIFKFNDFRLDVDRSALYHRDDLIKEVERKSLEVLAALLRTPNNLVSHDEIIEQVWRDNPHGVTAARINQYVSKLQKLFEKYEPELKFIENVRGRGYIFTFEVYSENLGSPSQPINITSQMVKQNSSLAGNNEDAVKGSSYAKSKLILAAAVFLLLASFAVWLWYPKNHHEEVERVVKESQLYESLVLYKNPASFKEFDLDRFWTAELDVNSNYDRSKIRQAAAKMVSEGKRYGDESKCEQFDFQSVEINANGDMAVVKTLEKWFIAVYGGDGKLIRNRTVGPYFVSYILRKIDGQWLIEKSNTGRATPSAPRLAKVEAMTEAASGKQFFIRITGEDFLSEIVHIKIIGEGCPENNPCLIPNSVLLKHSKLSDNLIENIPLTLASGAFLVVAHNGESKASNSLTLTVR